MPSLRAALLLALALSRTAQANAADAVAIVLSEKGGAYAEAAAALRGELPSGASVGEGQDLPPADSASAPRLVVAIGSSACAAAVREARSPTLCTLIPRAAFERATGNAGARTRALSAVFLDQPPSRQMALLRLLLPRAKRVALLFGPESSRAEGAFTAAAARRGLRTDVAHASGPDDLSPALQRLFEGGAEALLAVPDASLYNAGTAQNILRAAIRSRVALVAFSPAYVRAGALASVHSTPQQAGRQAGVLAREFLGGRALPAPQPPAEFSVALNAQVARSLGLELPDAETLAAQLRAQEKSP